MKPFRFFFRLQGLPLVDQALNEQAVFFQLSENTMATLALFARQRHLMLLAEPVLLKALHF